MRREGQSFGSHVEDGQRPAEGQRAVSWGSRGCPGLTGQDQIQELEGRLEAGAGDAALVGVQGQEGQAAEEGQEAGPHGEAAGHVVAVEHAVELRRARLVLVAVGQQGGEDDEGEDLWCGRGIPRARRAAQCLPKPLILPVYGPILLTFSGQFWPLPPCQVLRASKSVPPPSSP